MKNNLSLAGSEIINESKSKINNQSIISTTTTPIKDQKIILKSYKITEYKDEQTPNTNKKLKIKDNNGDKKESKYKNMNSLDLSKIKYNDGYILTDAANSNPGFGLWALKINSNKDNKNIDNNKTNNRKSNNSISTIKNDFNDASNINKITITTSNNLNNNKINDKSLNISNNLKKEEIKKRNKLLIEYLKMKCNDLETKCTNLVSNLDQKIYMCNNSFKLKREYEKILKDNIKETKFIQEKCNKLSIDNSKLSKIYKNVENEVNRLLNVLNTDKENMQKLKDEFNNRLLEEANERERLNKILKESQENLHTYEEETNEKIKENKNKMNNLNNNIEIMIKKESEARKTFDDENLNDVILELELKICDLKKKINSQDEENDKLRKILKYKEEKNNLEQKNLTNLNFLLKLKNENQKNDLNIVSRQDTLIKELIKKSHIKKYKLSKSQSLKKVNK